MKGDYMNYFNKEPIIFSPLIRLREEFVPLTNELYPGIVPHYLVSNFGRVFNTYYGEFEEEFFYNGYSRVTICFYRNRNVVPVTKAIDRSEEHTSELQS